MIRFKGNVIEEKVENLFVTDKEKREKYIGEIWEMLKKSYESIGGIKTGGFESKELLIDKIPFWKILKSNGKVVGALFYKEKEGRKRVATCTNGTDEAKRLLAQAIKKEPERGYFEISKGSWGFIRKQFLPDDLIKFMVPLDKVEELTNKKIYRLNEIPEEILIKAGLSPDDEKNKPFVDFIYARKINNELQPKVMVGTIGKNIIPK